jgi:hypothetical protein
MAVMVIDPGPIPHAEIRRYDDADLETGLQQAGVDPETATMFWTNSPSAATSSRPAPTPTDSPAPALRAALDATITTVIPTKENAAWSPWGRHPSSTELESVPREREVIAKRS